MFKNLFLEKKKDLSTIYLPEFGRTDVIFLIQQSGQIVKIDSRSVHFGYFIEETINTKTRRDKKEP